MKVFSMLYSEYELTFMEVNMVKGRMRELVLLELEHYQNTKRFIEEYEAIAPQTGIRPQGRGSGGHADPTAFEAMRLLEPSEDIKRIKGWLWAIDAAYAMLLSEAPYKAQLMELLYPLFESSEEKNLTREQIMDKLHISEPTLYRWREDILNAVLIGAIQAGIISPYSKQKLVLSL